MRKLLSSVNIYAGPFDALVCWSWCVVFFFAVCFAACLVPEFRLSYFIFDLHLNRRKSDNTDVYRTTLNDTISSFLTILPYFVSETKGLCLINMQILFANAHDSTHYLHNSTAFSVGERTSEEID
jgi:hypothetical protein